MTQETKSRVERLKNKKRPKREKKPKQGRPIVRKLIRYGLLLALLLVVVGASFFGYYVATAPKLDEQLLKDPLTSQIVDKNGDLIMEFGVERREFVHYEDIPELMRDAILSTEDARFFDHHGIDFWRLGGAVVANVRDGFGSQGASTLTQQVIKNSFDWSDKTLKRKAQEAWLSIQLERKFTKEEIFEMYFNKVLMSGSVYGFGTGAEYFFDKPLAELEPHEAALLAGLPQSPNAYNPFQHPEQAKKRRDTVLMLMNKHGKITEEQMNASINTPVESTLAEGGGQLAEQTKYPAYVDVVLNEIEEAGLIDMLAEGVTVHTSLDPDVQQSVERAINLDELYESPEMEAGMTVLDTATSAIVAVGGGRNYSGRNFNFATKPNAQPGSIIKPILVYGPAIEYLNWSTGTTLVDEPYQYRGTNKSIQNVDGMYQGALTMRDALARSRNIPAVKAFEEVGVTNAKQFAGNLGLKYKEMDASNALGGGEYNFSTVEMAGAYAAFGNGGTYTKPYAVKKIVHPNGETLDLKPASKMAMADSTAYMVTDMLRDVLTKGTGQLANVPGIDLAGKTGTTDYPQEILEKYNMKASDVPATWFAGYSSKYTVAAWGGYKNYTDPITTYEQGRHVPQNLFRIVMSETSYGSERMTRPPTVEERTVLYGSIPLALASPGSAGATTELFVAGTAPTIRAEKPSKPKRDDEIEQPKEEEIEEEETPVEDEEEDGTETEEDAEGNETDEEPSIEQPEQPEPTPTPEPAPQPEQPDPTPQPTPPAPEPAPEPAPAPTPEPAPVPQPTTPSGETEQSAES
ncbi:PBP1A family penicillin-binding protein [Planococcaceae bacterium Storch 2/2-2]|nr:PBP1A family penicillin-binding protein [Planococcaceae bacterium Storch 2/2-2]